MSLHGKGWFIWQVSRCEGGAPEAIAQKAVSAGLTHVLIKIAERTYGFGFDKNGRDLVPPIAEALRARGLQVWGWHYIYGDQPTGEASIAIKRSTELHLDGYVIDAESEFKLPGKAAVARTFMSALRAGLPNLPIALSSYRYPSLHPQLPWKDFLEKCDLSMPQVYWEQAHNPDQQLVRCANEFANPALVGWVRPMLPTGSAYGVGNWKASPEEVKRFLDKAISLALPAANFYSWDYATSTGNTALWDTVASFDWPGAKPQDIVARFFAALNAHDVEQVVGLYQLNAGHVTAERTLIGVDALRVWYTDLFQKQLPGAQFTVQAESGEGSSRRVTWTASSAAGDVLDGDDTFGLRDGLIQYHYTYFNRKTA
jgi:SnoaL-like domain